MKTLILLLAIVAVSCRHKETIKPIIEGQRNNSNLTNVSIYRNLTKTRNVVFWYRKNYRERTCNVYWDIWVDGDIMESGGQSNVKLEDIPAYQQRTFQYADSIMPELLKIKW